jgi:RimJ/RimL family protein N-acetyltransferase
LRQDQLQLKQLHVSRAYRQQGLGRTLFQLAVQKARQMGAKKLYISATPSENTVDFYLRLGCTLVGEPDPELFVFEPENIHMEYAIFPVLETDRLILRPLTTGDVLPLHRILNEEDILHYFPNPASPSVERVEKLIGRQLAHWEEHGMGWWGVVPQGQEELIGWSGLQFLPETDEVEVGYLLSRAYWGKGLATEAAKAALTFGFQTLGLTQIVGLVHPQHIASQRVLEKAGLTFVNRAEYFGMAMLRYAIELPGKILERQ